MKSVAVYIVKNLPGNLGERIRQICYAKFFGHRRFRIAEHVTLGLVQGAISGGEDLLICPEVKLFSTTGTVTFGRNVFINYGCFLSADRSAIEIGDNSILGPGVTIWASNHRFQEKSRLIVDQGYEAKKVTIGEDVWIGANVTILPGAFIGEGCVIGAGAVVTAGAVPSYTIVAGVPARKIGERK